MLRKSLQDERTNHPMKDLGELVDHRNARFTSRFSESLLDEMMNQGDPVADHAIAALDERAYDPDGSQLQRLQALADGGDDRAEAFFARARHQPDWLEPGLVRHGQRLALAYSGHYGLSLTHSLFSGALFARATLVTQSTGRLGSNPARRIQETGAFIAAILRPDGLEPGSLGFQTAVRVRLLHGSIRSWLNRSPGFAEAYCGTPIDQTMLAMTLSLFDYLNLRSFTRLGVPLSKDDLRAHHHMWRYVGYLIGIDDRLLTTSLQEERELWGALVAHQTFPSLFGEVYLQGMVDTVGDLLGAKERRKSFIRNLYLYLSGPDWFGVDCKSERDPMLGLLRVAGLTLGSAQRWLPGASRFMERRGATRLRAAEEMARTHGFGVQLEVDEDDAAHEESFQHLASGVRERFRPRKSGVESIAYS
jgi:hypothetical protein